MRLNWKMGSFMDFMVLGVPSLNPVIMRVQYLMAVIWRALTVHLLY
nr:hypothetical protein Iba_chr05aCG14420 [Ipomoea batatas]